MFRDDWKLGMRNTKNSCPVSWPRLPKMAGRGRGRGKGRGLTFDVGMIGFGRGEALPAATLQPPPLYPVSEIFKVTFLGLNHKP